MFRNSSQILRAARITSLLFATLLIAAVGSPLEAKGVTNLSKKSRPSTELQFSSEVEPESPSDETFLVQTWIPGFDDDEPAFTCSPISAPNLLQAKSSHHSRFRKLADDNGCGVMLRMLPWNFQSVRVGSEDFILPII
jgi:hypothetical protein